MAIPWNEDDPHDAALILQNLTKLLRQIARRARLRQPPTVEMAQDWHRKIYEGARLPVPYYAGEIRDSDRASSWVGLANKAGTIETNKLSDLVAVPGDPCRTSARPRRFSS